MGYYCIRLTNNTSKHFMIVLYLGKYKYTQLRMGFKFTGVFLG